MAKRALLMGINQYRIPGANLRGCVNDVRQMRAILLEIYGFTERDIAVLTDLDATKSAMQRHLEGLVKAARPGDVLLVHYSGHGSNVPDASGDEADFRDEILCPTDLDWKDPLLDDWLRSLFDTLAQGASLTVVMDCCHSGTATRALMAPDNKEPRERFLACPLDLVAVESGRELRGALKGGRQACVRKEIASDVKDVDLPEILITACRDTQTSVDALIEGGYHGALTHALAGAIREAAGKITYRRLHARATEILSRDFSQAPQLEGRSVVLDRQFLAPLS